MYAGLQNYKYVHLTSYQELNVNRNNLVSMEHKDSDKALASYEGSGKGALSVNALAVHQHTGLVPKFQSHAWVHQK